MRNRTNVRDYLAGLRRGRELRNELRDLLDESRANAEAWRDIACALADEIRQSKRLHTT